MAQTVGNSGSTQPERTRKRRDVNTPGPAVDDGRLFTSSSFDVTRTNGSCVVAVAGEVDLAVAAELASVLSEVGGQVTLDLTRVTLIDLLGLAVLARAQRDIVEGGGTLHLGGAPRT